ncbi:multifunctional CCA addition/repair protein [Thalassotalea sp. PS06]|uniref:multifunctional CCA addition/repair protein n=1 Tax=Thalassotalea sp. PS06 TaxID=2594005 RepID=UPI0011644B92|nr:multifunctional CCA addition/repair protein [Thalassotalea sp. PS06]QDP02280.1 multifunctional CCA addition/repair protein [Thalassotalea sp. PS06]
MNPIKDNKLQIYLVGGAVRDQLLGREVYDRDWVVVGASFEQMLDYGFTPVGKDFPVFLHPDTKEEFALARTERKQGSGYTGFVCHADPDVTLEQDLLRRDLTINAMAMDADGNLFDPYHGKDDLDNRVFRHVSDAFSEDPLRVLRLARFAARYFEYGFTIHPDTQALLESMAASGELENLSGDRIFKEVSRALTEPNPEQFIEVLRHCGALKVIWPELDALWGVPNPVAHHGEVDSGIHTLMVLKEAVKLTDDIGVRFAALCHDLGKGLTEEQYWPSHHGHEKSGLPLVEDVCDRFRVPKQITNLALRVCEYHLHCHRIKELKPKTILKLLNALDPWRNLEMLENFVLACHADSSGRLGKEDSPYPQGEFLLEVASECKKVVARPFVEQGLQGKAISEAIVKQRGAIIADMKKKRIGE